MNTPLMQACAAIQNLLAAWQCPLKSVRLLNLHSGSIIKEHCDHELSFEQGEARLHFPVFTNSGVEFYVEGHLLPMQEGECGFRWIVRSPGTFHHDLERCARSLLTPGGHANKRKSNQVREK